MVFSGLLVRRKHFCDSLYDTVIENWCGSNWICWLSAAKGGYFAASIDNSGDKGSGRFALILIIVDLFPWWIITHCLIALPFLIFISAALLWSIPRTIWCHFTEMVPLWWVKCNPSVWTSVGVWCGCLSVFNGNAGTKCRRIRSRLSFKWNTINAQVYLYLFRVETQFSLDALVWWGQVFLLSDLLLLGLLLALSVSDGQFNTLIQKYFNKYETGCH